MVKPPLRTKTLGTKVSEEEFAQLEAAASERGLTLSEWCRETLLGSVNGQGEKSTDSGRADQALMAELVALRAILLNLVVGERGEANGGGEQAARAAEIEGHRCRTRTVLPVSELC